MKRNKLLQGILIVTTILASVSVIGCTKTIVVEPEPEVVIEEPEVIEEPVVEEPIIEEPIEEEPVVEEPVEINPMDMSARYGLDFETPIYTEEEVAEAKERLDAKSTEIEDRFNKMETKEEYSEICDDIAEDYYKTHQDLGYYLYNNVSKLDTKAIIKEHGVDECFYYDEENELIYVILDGTVMINGVINDEEFEFIYGIGGIPGKGTKTGVAVSSDAQFQLDSQENNNWVRNYIIEKYNRGLSVFNISEEEMIKNGMIPLTKSEDISLTK